MTSIQNYGYTSLYEERVDLSLMSRTACYLPVHLFGKNSIITIVLFFALSVIKIQKNVYIELFFFSNQLYLFFLNCINYEI